MSEAMSKRVKITFSLLVLGSVWGSRKSLVQQPSRLSGWSFCPNNPSARNGKSSIWSSMLPILSKRFMEAGQLRLRDGSLVEPKVQLIDRSGKVYDLASPALDEKRNSLRKLRPPRDRAYPTVRIRSDKPIHVSRIYWRSYNQKDLK